MKKNSNIKVKVIKSLLEKYTGKKVTLVEGVQDDPEYNKLYKELVPPQGKASTIEGEMLRAISKIGYRWYNDGDYYFRGYGLETCGSAYRYLVSKQKLIPGAIAALRKGKTVAKPANFRGSDEDYTKCIEDAVAEIVKYIVSKNGNYTPNGTGPDDGEDMLKVEPRKRSTVSFSGSPRYSPRRRYKW